MSSSSGEREEASREFSTKSDFGLVAYDERQAVTVARISDDPHVDQRVQRGANMATVVDC